MRTSRLSKWKSLDVFENKSRNATDGLINPEIRTLPARISAEVAFVLRSRAKGLRLAATCW